MIEHVGSFEVELTCDCCGEIQEFEYWSDALVFIRDRSNGWVNFKNENDEWEDRCPDCNPYNGK